MCRNNRSPVEGLDSSPHISGFPKADLLSLPEVTEKKTRANNHDYSLVPGSLVCAHVGLRGVEFALKSP